MKPLIPLLLLPFLLSNPFAAEGFVGSFDIVLSEKRANGNEPTHTVSYHFAKDKTAMIIAAQGNQPDFRLIFDPAAETITGLFEMRGKKGGYILPMTEDQWPGMATALQSSAPETDARPNYTGEEKEIGGHLCREVQAENDAYRVRMWVATDIPLSMTRVLSYQSVGAGKSKEEAAMFDQFGIEGLPLELTLESKQDKGDVTIRVVNLTDTVDEAVFNTEGYDLIPPSPPEAAEPPSPPTSPTTTIPVEQPPVSPN